MLAATAGWTQESQRRKAIPPAAPPSREITGVVLRPDGATPPAKALVRFVWNDRGSLAKVYTWTDPEGRFTLQADEPGRIGALHASVLKYALRSSAIDPIAAGTKDVVLRLGERRILTLDVRDADGHVVPQAQTHFSWELAGMKVSDYPGPRQENGEPLWWELPDVPFHVTVEAVGFEQTHLGPLDPEQIITPLEVRLKPVARLRGRVTYQDRPVEGAEVGIRSAVWRAELDPHSPTIRGSDGARTDAQGRFDLEWRSSGSYELSARSDALDHEGTLGPIELDPGHMPEDLEIVLSRPLGTIRGKVVMPADHAPWEIWLVTSPYRGLMGLRPDGSFVLPDLPAGRLRVRVVESYSDEGEYDHYDGWFWVSHGRERAPDWLTVEPTFDVEVRSGERVELAVDLTATPPCRLDGRILVSGVPPPHRPRGAETYGDPGPRVCLDSEDGLGFVSRTELAADGTFTLHASRPGSYRLQIDVPMEGKNEWTLLERVRLERGTQTWELDVPTGNLHVLPHEDSGNVTPFMGDLRWQPRENLRYFACFGEEDEASRVVVYRGVPAGRAELVNESRDARQVLLVTEITAGETQTVRSP